MRPSTMRQRAALLVVGLAAVLAQAAPAQGKPSGTRRAVVVGVSQYLFFPPHEQLHYAAADAGSFYAFLRSKGGGALPEANIRLLLDTAAKAGEVFEALRWLRLQSQPGDEAIIYFAGHGGIDATTSPLDAYLLATDAMPDNYLAGGAVSVSSVSGLAGLMARAGVTTVMITDASFRAREAVSAEHAAANLFQPWIGVTKFVSNGPEQVSLEGEQWGGGHGVFTYFLVAGLQGLADADANGVVTVGELAAYVGGNVRRETSGKQTPVWTGDPQFPIAAVDTATLRAARARVTHQ